MRADLAVGQDISRCSAGCSLIQIENIPRTVLISHVPCGKRLLAACPEVVLIVHIVLGQRHRANNWTQLHAVAKTSRRCRVQLLCLWHFITLQIEENYINEAA